MCSKDKQKEINRIIHNLTTKESSFVVSERQVIEDLLESTDNMLVDVTLKYFSILKQLKGIEKEKIIYTQK